MAAVITMAVMADMAARTQLQPLQAPTQSATSEPSHDSCNQPRQQPRVTRCTAASSDDPRRERRRRARRQRRQRARRRRPNPHAEHRDFATRKNKVDPGWKYCHSLVEGDTNTIVCNFCGKITKGGTTRAKQHLIGKSGNIAACKKTPPNVIKELKEYMATKKSGTTYSTSGSGNMANIRDFEFGEPIGCDGSEEDNVGLKKDLEWTLNKLSKEPKGKEDAKVVLMPSFWNSVVYTLKVMAPLVKVLRLVDGEKKAAMGYIYEAMYKAKETIIKSFNSNESKYKDVFAIIDKRWNCQLHRPLHAAAHFLNPEFFYDNTDLEFDFEVTNGLFECIKKLIPQFDVQQKILTELHLYKIGAEHFGSDFAMAQRKTHSPMLQDVKEIGVCLSKFIPKKEIGLSTRGCMIWCLSNTTNN
ncbi:hypothetical protein GmHk_17G049393 [Glycine max]|nr:hypothetical protein GmHk_17G049393 [Glycine max]